MVYSLIQDVALKENKQTNYIWPLEKRIDDITGLFPVNVVAYILISGWGATLSELIHKGFLNTVEYRFWKVK